MKKIFILIAVVGMFTAKAQHEEFFQTLDDIEYKSNRATAMMLMAERHPNFIMVTGSFQVLDSIYIIEGESRIPVAYEIIQLANPSKNVLVQFAYLNDELYGKNISMLYPAEQMELANNKYDSLNIRLEESHRMKYFRNGGEVATIDKDLAAGRTKVYPIKNVEPDILEVTTGVVYNIEDLEQLDGIGANKGVWVFFTIYDTYDQHVNIHYNFPKLSPPYLTMDELMAKQPESPESYSTDKADEEAAERHAKMEAEKKAKEEAAAAAAAEEEENKKGKKKKKNKKSKEDKE